MEIAKVAIPLIIAVFTCFFGYKLNKIVITIAAFASGYALGSWLAGTLGVSEDITFFISMIAGIIGGFGGFRFYLIGIFCLCFFSVFTWVQTIIPEEGLKWIIAIIGGLLAGFVAMKFVKPVMIISTSISGGTIIATTLFDLLKLPTDYLLIAEIIIIILGIIFQFNSNHSDT